MDIILTGLSPGDMVREKSTGKEMHIKALAEFETKESFPDFPEFSWGNSQDLDIVKTLAMCYWMVEDDMVGNIYEPHTIEKI